MDTVRVVAGVAAGGINVIGLIPYVRDILRHKTKPERATWWIWALLNIIAFKAQLDSGATWSLGLSIGQLIAVGSISILAFWFGYGRLGKKDVVSVIVAVLGVLLWWMTDRPIVALIIVVLIDIFGLSLTIRKSWKAPFTETLSAWIMATCAGALSVAALDSLDPTVAIYPLYILLGNAVLTVVLIQRRKEIKE